MALTQPQQARRLTADEEAALVRDYNHTRDPRKLAQLGSSCTPLVKAYARRTWRRNSRIDLDDLVPEGLPGLLEAIRRSVPDRGEARLATYATWWVRLGLQGFVIRNGRQTQMARCDATNRLFSQLRATRARRTAAGLPTDPETLAAALNVPVQMLVEFDVWLGEHEISMQAPMRARDGNFYSRAVFGETLPDGVDTVARMEEIDVHARLMRAATEFRDGLNDSERRVFDARVISSDQDPPTLTDLGREVGRTRQRV